MLKRILHRKAFVALAVLMPVWVAAPLALAVTFKVNSIADLPDDLATPGTCHTTANTCTLRAAVMQANRTSGVGATIMLPAGVYKLTIPAAGTDDERNGDLNLTTPASGNPVITITGAGPGATIIDANQLDRAFHVHPNRIATISGVTIRNGYIVGDTTFGGGIFNEGVLTVSNAVITLNNAAVLGGSMQSAVGGGISNGGSLTVMNSTISQNGARQGGGIYNFGDLNVRDSTIGPENRAEQGGGIYTGRGLTMRNSTISGNHAQFWGGGIMNTVALTAMNSTISQNDAGDSGGGIANYGTAGVYNATIVFNGVGPAVGSGGGVFNNEGATFNLRNTLLAGNSNGITQIYEFYEDCSGTINSYGQNTIWKETGCLINSQSGGNWNHLNALNTLGPLQNNGGPTFTHALLSGSNAIDIGAGCIDYASNPLLTDQRGAPRVVGARCDVGAFEYSLPPPTADAIEYHHAAFDHYFITAIADEITKLDNGTFVGWTRTGQTFKVYPNTAALLVDVCRFFSTAFAPKSSHFYTPDANECASVKANPDWQFEAVVFYMAQADANGNCAAGTQPIYRVYNNGQGAAPNHRYTTSLTIRTQMLAQGWIPEGYGPIGVIMCSPV
jgi:hypothetical protein